MTSHDSEVTLRTALARTQARYKALVEQIPAVLYEDIQNPDGSFESTFVGPQIASMLGISPETYLHDATDQWESRLHPDDRELAIREYHQAIASGGELTQEYRLIRNDGHAVWIRDQFTVIDDGTGGPVCIQGVMFDITELKDAQAAAASQVALLQRVDLIGQRFTDLVLAGADLGKILLALEEIIGCPVILEDAAHQVVELSAPVADQAEILETWAAHSRKEHHSVDGHAIQPGPGCWWVGIQLRTRTWGRLHVMTTDLDEVDQLAVDRVAAAIALTLHSEQYVAHLADHERGALMSDVWEGRYTSAAEVVQRARRLGTDLAGMPLVAMVIEPAPPAPAGKTSSRGERPRLDDDQRQHVRAVIVRSVREAFASPEVHGLSAVVGDRVLAILGILGDAVASARTVAEEIAAMVGERAPDVVVSIGISRGASPDHLRQALAEANEAATYGLRSARRSGVHAFEDLGIHHLLQRLSDGPELAHFVEAQLQPVLDHDAKSSSPLLPTLRAFLASGGRKAETARALHLERRSLYYRLDRIEALLEKDLDDQEVRTQLEIGLRGLDLLSGRGPATR